LLIHVLYDCKKVTFGAAAAAGIIWNWWWLGSTVLFISATKTVNKALRCFFYNLDVLFVDFEFSNNTELGNDVDDVILDVFLGHFVFYCKWELDCEFNLEKIYGKILKTTYFLSH